MPAAERKLFHKRDFRACVQAFDPDQSLHGKSEQSVARQDRHGFAEDLVAGWFAAAEIVVIQRGKIVVDERISVDHLERASRLDRRSVRNKSGSIRNGGRALQTKDRANALAAREQAVSHGAMDRFRRRGFRRREAIERGVDAPGFPSQKFFERHYFPGVVIFSGRNGSGW